MSELQFPPYIILLLFAAAINLSLAFVGFHKMRERVFFYFTIAFSVAGVWPLIYAAELSFADPDIIIKIAFIRELIIQLFPVFFMIFMFLFVKQKMPPGWLTAAASLLGGVAASLLAANGVFWQAWSSETFVITAEGYRVLSLMPDLWAKYSLIIYHCGIYSILIHILLKASTTHKYPYKAQFQIIIISIVMVITVSIIYLFRIISFGPYNPVPATFILSSSLIATAVFKYKLLSVIPYARERVFEVIGDPVLIIDSKDSVVDFNESARRALRMNSSHIGITINEIFASAGLNWDSLKERRNDTVSTKWGTGRNRIYNLTVTETVKGDLSGSLIIMTDITDQMNALTTKHEREIVNYKESILGDMHDGIGGTVATAAMLAQTAHSEKDPIVKNKLINKIADLLENGSFELRSMLNILDKETIDWKTLVADMRSFSTTVLEGKTIRRRFDVHGEPYSFEIDFDQYLSIFRLFKETVVNIVKHSEADKTDIDIYFEENFIINVKDNGIGFENSDSKGFGLKNMQKRAEKLGGRLEIVIENGTNINISISTQIKQKVDDE